MNETQKYKNLLLLLASERQALQYYSNLPKQTRESLAQSANALTSFSGLCYHAELLQFGSADNNPMR